MTVNNLKDELYQAIHDQYIKIFNGSEEETQRQIEKFIDIIKSGFWGKKTE